MGVETAGAYNLIGTVKDLPSMSYAFFRMVGSDECLSVVEHDKEPPTDEDWCDHYIVDLQAALKGSFFPATTIVFTLGGLPTTTQRIALSEMRDRAIELSVESRVGVVTPNIITRVASFAIRQFGATSLIACKDEQSVFDSLGLPDEERKAVMTIRQSFHRPRVATKEAAI